MNELTLSVSLLSAAYDQGVFPMAKGSEPDSELFWCRPPKRAILLPANFHVPKRLARLIRQKPFQVRWNDDFAEVMRQCALQRPEGSWINPALLEVYTAWHAAGGAFCLSLFDGDNRVGGIYGVQRGGVFMAESMFSRVPNASSIALVILMAGLTQAGIEMVDVQFENPHLTKFNVNFLPCKKYEEEVARLKDKNVVLRADYFDFAGAISFTQSLSQTS